MASNDPAYARAYQKKHYAANKQYYIDKAREHGRKVAALN
jgi:hypothetical protein